MTENNLLMIPLNVAKAALLFMPSDDVRFYLNGLAVRVDGGDVELTASDGWTCYRHLIPDYHGVDDVEMIIPQYVVKLALAQARKKKSAFLELDVGQHFLGDIGFRPIEGKYPEYDMAKWRSGEKSASTTYMVSLLDRLQKACNLLGDGYPILPMIKHYEYCGVLEIDPVNLALVMALEV